MGLAKTNKDRVDNAPLVLRKELFQVFLDFIRVGVFGPAELAGDVGAVRVNPDGVLP